MSKGPSFLFEIERSSRKRVVEIERVHCNQICIQDLVMELFLDILKTERNVTADQLFMWNKECFDDYDCP